jgi:hypothetical protein
LAIRSPHGCVERVPGAERFTAALARPVSGIEGVRSPGIGLHGSIFVVEQTIAHGETSDLVEVNGLA